jgi:hypothetical protein
MVDKLWFNMRFVGFIKGLCMKKTAVLLMGLLCVSMTHASRLSEHFRKANERERIERENAWRQDMNFADFSFRLEKSYIDERGEKCRDYVFRSKSNPYKHGFYTVCDPH